MIHISPSILACDFSKLAQEVEKVETAGADYLHLDVMDGHFVPNISFGPDVIASLRKKSKMFFDCHLMITEPKRYIDRFVKAGADIITVHYESLENLDETIDLIKSFGVKVGVSLKPSTNPDVLLPYLHRLNMVLIMTVEPGFGGQKFMVDTLEKVRFVRDIAIERNLNFDIEVDGGIGEANVKSLAEAGANVIVAGSAIFGAVDVKMAISNLKSMAEESYR